MVYSFFFFSLSFISVSDILLDVHVPDMSGFDKYVHLHISSVYQTHTPSYYRYIPVTPDKSTTLHCRAPTNLAHRDKVPCRVIIICRVHRIKWNVTWLRSNDNRGFGCWVVVLYMPCIVCVNSNELTYAYRETLCTTLQSHSWLITILLYP